MPTPIRMPQLGESVAEGTIGKWLKQPGEAVQRDEPLVEIITDKVNAEIPSPVAGVLQEIAVPEGTTVQVGQVIATIAETSEAAAEPGDGAARATAPAEPSPAPTAPAGDRAAEVAAAREPAADRPAEPAPDRPAEPAPVGPPIDRRRFYTPVVLRMAAEHGLDLSQISGTGEGGRVTRKDVERYLEARRAGRLAPQPVAAAPAAAPAEAPAPAPPSAPAAAPPTAPVAPPEDEEWLPVTPVRRRIAERMLESVRTAPHAWAMVEVDVTGLVKLREALLAEWQRRAGFELTYLPFFVRAVCEALQENPRLNAVWADDKIVVKKRVHASIAVSAEQGLLVPVLHNADSYNVAGLARALRDLVQRARAGKLTLADIQGGTITINNPGTFGSILSQPIINQPQTAIVTMEAIVKRPVVIDDMIAVRSMMNVCCSFDHRVVDGAEVLRFLNALKRRLEAYRPGQSIF